MTRQFLAIHPLSAPGGEPVRAALARVAQAAHGRGVHPIETFFSVATGMAYTFVEADTEARVRDAYAAAGLPAPEVVPGERVFTELLDEPRRAR